MADEVERIHALERGIQERSRRQGSCTRSLVEDHIDLGRCHLAIFEPRKAQQVADRVLTVIANDVSGTDFRSHTAAAFCIRAQAHMQLHRSRHALRDVREAQKTWQTERQHGSDAQFEAELGRKFQQMEDTYPAELLRDRFASAAQLGWEESRRFRSGALVAMPAEIANELLAHAGRLESQGSLQIALQGSLGLGAVEFVVLPEVYRPVLDLIQGLPPDAETVGASAEAAVREQLRRTLLAPSHEVPVEAERFASDFPCASIMDIRDALHRDRFYQSKVVFLPESACNSEEDVRHLLASTARGRGKCLADDPGCDFKHRGDGLAMMIHAVMEASVAGWHPPVEVMKIVVIERTGRAMSSIADLFSSFSDSELGSALPALTDFLPRLVWIQNWIPCAGARACEIPTPDFGGTFVRPDADGKGSATLRSLLAVVRGAFGAPPRGSSGPLGCSSPDAASTDTAECRLLKRIAAFGIAYPFFRRMTEAWRKDAALGKYSSEICELSAEIFVTDIIDWVYYDSAPESSNEASGVPDRGVVRRRLLWILTAYDSVVAAYYLGGDTHGSSHGQATHTERRRTLDPSPAGPSSTGEETRAMLLEGDREDRYILFKLLAEYSAMLSPSAMNSVMSFFSDQCQSKIKGGNAGDFQILMADECDSLVIDAFLKLCGDIWQERQEEVDQHLKNGMPFV